MATIDEVLALEAPAFALAVKAIITGDAVRLRAALMDDPNLVHARSASRHHAMLLHYVSANGVESELQSPVANADEIAAILLAAGASVDAPCDAYEGRWATTMDLLVSSDHPTEAAVAGRLVDVLCSAGAKVDGVRGDGSPLATALCFATLDCVEALIARGARTDNPIFAASAGRVDWLRSWLDGRESEPVPPVPLFLPLAADRAIAAEQALVFASMCGQTEIVRLLLDRKVGVDASPPGSHWTATALHSAAIQGQAAVVQLLLQRGADPSLSDSRYGATPPRVAGARTRPAASAGAGCRGYARSLVVIRPGRSTDIRHAALACADGCG
jgi:ankyrin repeat protein